MYSVFSPNPGTAARIRTLAAEYPTLVLIIVLIILVGVTGLIEPNYLSVSGARNTLLQAAPLGILAGAQTILMLTGGIDLSITMIATGSAYVAANQSPNGALIAIVVGIVVGIVAGSANGVVAPGGFVERGLEVGEVDVSRTDVPYATVLLPQPFQ